jgi:predicted nucleotidyltransferase
MKPSQALDAHRADIRRVVAENRAANARVFGSVLRQADTEDSDLDIVVDPTADTTMLDIARIQRQLQKMLGTTVDVLTPKALPESFRDRILAEAAPV